MSWYTQFRPRKISELHLESVRTQLQNYMQSGAFPQVFLFAGPKGTGKTSASRILGAILNDPANDNAVEANFFSQKRTVSERSVNKSAKSTKKFSYQEPDVTSAHNEAIFTGKSYIVQELDAASNRGIDDVRSLKERVQMPPQDGRMAVYILDEAHMLTTEAFNALLKLLEEPPQHAVFILATTERHKIPATVLSRMAEIQFRKASKSELLSALESVLHKVSLSADSDVLDAIASQANGSFRDAVKVLEKVASAQKCVQSEGNKRKNQKITMEHMQMSMQGFLDDASIISLFRAVIEKQSAQVVTQIEYLRSSGVDASSCYPRIIEVLHRSLLQSLDIESGDPPFSQQISIFFLDELQHISTQSELLPLLQLEIKLLQIIERAVSKQKNSPQSGSGNSSENSPGTNFSDTTASAHTGSKKSAQVIQLSQKSVTAQVLDETRAMNATPFLSNTSPAPVIKSDSLVIPDYGDSSELLNDWQKFVDLVQNKNATIAALLRSAKPIPEKSNGVAKVQVFYSFHKDQLSQPKFLQLLQECAHDMTGQNVGFEFELGLNEQATATDVTVKQTEDSIQNSTDQNQTNSKAVVALVEDLIM